MKKILISLLGIALMYSCNDISQLPSIDDEILPTTMLKSAGDGVYDALGYGYDIMGEYLAPNSIKYAVIDVAKLKSDNPYDVDYNSTTQSVQEYTYNSSSESYLESITNKVNANINYNYKLSIGSEKFNLFSSETKYNLTFDYSNTSKIENSSLYMYGSYNIVKRVKRLYMTNDISILRNYLTSSFTRDLSLLTADQIIQKYGVYVLTDFTIGGKMSFLFRAKQTKYLSETTREATIKAGVNSSLSALGMLTTGISVDATYTNNTSTNYQSNYKNMMLKIVYTGGEGSGVTYNLESGYPTISVNSWEQSVNSTNAGLIDIDWSKVIPIWELTTDVTQRNALITAAANYVKNNQNIYYDIMPVSGYMIMKDLTGNMQQIPTGTSAYNSEFPTYSQFLTIMYSKTNICSLYSNESYVFGYALKEQLDGTLPVYLYIKNFDNTTNELKYLYTSTKVDRTGYTYIGFIGYAYTSQSDGTQLPVFSSNYPTTASHIEGETFYYIKP